MQHIPETRSIGGFVVNAKGEVLFVQEYGVYWGLPRGHVEPGEDDMATARREIFEESGVCDLTYQCDLGGYSRFTFDEAGAPNYKEMKHLRYFCFTTAETTLNPTDPSITDAAWLAPAEARSRLINTDDIIFFDQAIKKLIKLNILTDSRR